MSPWEGSSLRQTASIGIHYASTEGAVCGLLHVREPEKFENLGRNHVRDAAFLFCRYAIGGAIGMKLGVSRDVTEVIECVNVSIG